MVIFLLILEGRPGAERFPAHCCRFKRLRYISDKQPHLELPTLSLNSWGRRAHERTVLSCQLSRCTHSIGQISQRLLICWGPALLLFCLFAWSAHKSYQKLLHISNIFMHTYFSTSTQPKRCWTWELHPGWCYNAALLPCSLHFHPELALLLVSSLGYTPLFYLFEALCSFLVWHNPGSVRVGIQEKLSFTMKKSMKCLHVPPSPARS